MIKNDNDLEEKYSKMIKKVSEDYSLCNLYIQYPGICPIVSSIEQSKIMEGPLIARLPKKSKTEMKKEYGKPKSPAMQVKPPTKMVVTKKTVIKAAPAKMKKC
jgi:hypothetical protein